MFYPLCSSPSKQDFVNDESIITNLSSSNAPAPCPASIKLKINVNNKIRIGMRVNYSQVSAVSVHQAQLSAG